MSVSQKFNDFVEKTIMMGIRYRLSLEKFVKKETEVVENLYKKRLMSELDRVRANAMQKIRINREIMDESFVDLI